jgi:hypothetical protein
MARRTKPLNHEEEERHPQQKLLALLERYAKQLGMILTPETS